MSKTQSQWSGMTREDRVAAVTKLSIEGLSYRDIALRLGAVSRNTIIGFAARNGIQGARPPGGSDRKGKSLIKRETIIDVAPKPKPAPPPTKPIPPKDKARLALSGIWAPSADQQPKSSVRGTAFLPLPDQQPIALHHVPLLGRCRWPVDGADGPGLLFCGAGAPETDPYCIAHQRLAYRPRAEKEPSHGKSARR